MAEKEYISLDTVYDIGTLEDWYINSVSQDDAPVWTEEHLEELLNDFYVIPKDTPAADVAPMKHGEWKQNGNIFECSGCGYSFEHEGYLHFFHYCPNCGAKMGGGDENA